MTKKKAKKSSKLQAEPSPGDWPNPRDVMSRPDRAKYVRGEKRSQGCVFCAAATSKPRFQTLCLFRGKYVMAVLNKYPYNNGHVLILPVRHESDLTRLKTREHEEIHLLLRETVRILNEVYAPGGFNVGLNMGSAAGAGLPDHMHYHIVPRWRGDTNFFPLLAGTKVVVETLEQTYKRLLPYFGSLDLKHD